MTDEWAHFCWIFNWAKSCLKLKPVEKQNPICICCYKFCSLHSVSSLSEFICVEWVRKIHGQRLEFHFWILRHGHARNFNSWAWPDSARLKALGIFFGEYNFFLVIFNSVFVCKLQKYLSLNALLHSCLLPESWIMSNTTKFMRGLNLFQLSQVQHLAQTSCSLLILFGLINK